MLGRVICAAVVLLGCSSSGTTRPPVLEDAGAIDLGADLGHTPTDTGTDTGAARDVAVADATVTDAVGTDVSDVSDATVTDAVGTDVSDEMVRDAVGTDVSDVSDVTVTDVSDVTDARGDVFDAGALADTPTADGSLGPWTPIAGGESCNARERSVPIQISPHVDPDAGPIDWITNPPASGPHFPNWARFGAFRDIPRGNWVHNLEHGGVVFLYRCLADAGDCATARDALVSIMTTLPSDPRCSPDAGEPRLRIVITNDAQIDTPIAGAAWGWLYAADCVDSSSLRTFFTRHAGMGPEDLCIDGLVP